MAEGKKPNQTPKAPSKLGVDKRQRPLAAGQQKFFAFIELHFYFSFFFFLF